MNSDNQQKAARLQTLTQMVGYALWQLQVLEEQSAVFFVLLVQAKPGIGIVAGEELVTKAQEKTFGQTVKRIEKAGLLDADLGARFEKLLDERNWLAHRSNADCRATVATGAGLDATYARLSSIADEATVLLRTVGELVEQYVTKHGVGQEQIQRDAKRILEGWHLGEA